MHEGVEDEPALTLDGVTVRYGQTIAVERASLVVGQGELVALVGPNGAGKSTLFRAALGLVPYDGQIVVHHLRRNCVAFVPQRLEVDLDFPITVGQVVAAGQRALRGSFRRRGGDSRAVARCLAEVDLDGFEHRPLGGLSGGQVQRVLIARALAQEPTVLLLDEPLAGVDTPSTEALVGLLARLAGDGAAIVVSTHDLALVRDRFPRCIAINRTIVGDGDPTVVLAPSGLERFFALETVGAA